MESLSGKLCEEEELIIKPFEYFEQQIHQKVHHFYLSGEILEPAYYVNMIHTIQTAGLQDTIYIHLNTPGGALTTGVQVVNSMKNSEATVICSLEGEANSLGSLIFLAADQFIVHDNTRMLIHNFTGAVYGKGREAEMEMEATLIWFEKLVRKYYTPFLTEKEFQGVLSDTDIWVQADDIRTRLEKMVKIKQKELKKAMG